MSETVSQWNALNVKIKDYYLTVNSENIIVYMLELHINDLNKLLNF